MEIGLFLSLLCIADVYLMNCANPNYMNQWEYKWWCQLCRGVKEKYKDGKDLLGSIFSLDLVNLKNPANPKPMNGGANGGGSSLCTGGDDPQLQWRDSQEVDATCSSQPPARGPSLLQEKTRS